MPSQPSSDIMGTSTYECPNCAMPTVRMAGGKYIQTLHCTACGWNMSVAKWNKIPKEEKERMYKDARRRRKQRSK